MHIPFVKLSIHYILLTLNVWIALLFTLSLYGNQKQNIFHFKTYNIMKATNNTQKLFTTGQIFGIIVFVALAAVAIYMATKGDWTGFNSVGLGK